MLLIVLRAYKKPFQSELKFLQKLKFKYDCVLNPFSTNLTVTSIRIAAKIAAGSSAQAPYSLSTIPHNFLFAQKNCPKINKKLGQLQQKSWNLTHSWNYISKTSQPRRLTCCCYTITNSIPRDYASSYAREVDNSR